MDHFKSEFRVCDVIRRGWRENEQVYHHLYWFTTLAPKSLNQISEISECMRILGFGRRIPVRNFRLNVIIPEFRKIRQLKRGQNIQTRLENAF